MLAGEMVMKVTAGRVTLSEASELNEPAVAVTVTAPRAVAVARPFTTVAPEDALQVAEAVRSCVVPSVYLPVAVNCWVVLRAMEAVVGDTASETRAAGCTVSKAVPLIEPDLAVIVDVLTAEPVAKPKVLIDAPAVAVHVTEFVTFAVVPSV